MVESTQLPQLLLQLHLKELKSWSLEVVPTYMFVGYTPVVIEGVDPSMTGLEQRATIKRRNGTRLGFHGPSLQAHMLDPKRLTRLDPSSKKRVPTRYVKMFLSCELARRLVILGYLDVSCLMKNVHRFTLFVALYGISQKWAMQLLYVVVPLHANIAR